MSVTTRAAALTALQNVVAAPLTANGITFERDPEEFLTATHTGVVVMRDGTPGNPEFLLSPLAFIWEHEVEFEVGASGLDRAAIVESVIALFEPALAADRTLGGAVEDARTMSAPEIAEHEVADAEAERVALVRVQLSYTTATAAGA